MRLAENRSSRSHAHGRRHNAALAEVLALARRRAHMEFLRAGELPDLGDLDVMAGAWR